MSHTRAYAFVSSVSPDDLRPTLISAMEAIYHVSDALDVVAPREARIFELVGLETALTEAAEALQQSVKDSKEAEEGADERAADAEARLEAKLQADPDEVTTLRAKLAEAEAARDAALERVEKVRHMVEAHADLVAGARKFVSASIGAGVPLKHARAVPRKRASEGR